MARLHSVWVVGFLLFSTGAQGSIAPFLEQGDVVFRARENPDRAQEALRIYRQAVADTNHQDAQALWREAMGCYFVGLRLTDSKTAKAEIFWEGQEAGKAAVKLDPGCAACHFWTAINMALYGETVGVFKMLFSLQEIQALLKKTLTLDPGYAHAGAYRLLGVIEQKLPGILGGSNDRALKYFNQAVLQAPDEPLNYLFLARLLREDLKRPDAALEIAKKGLEIRDVDPDRLESKEAQADIQKLLKDWR